MNPGLSENEVAPTPTKRRRTAGGAPGSATRRRKGKLSKLPDMPLDILYEIFSHLHPQDLLKISWTTKAFRRVLTNISSRTVWRDSIASVEGAPACPDDMNEVEYVNLLFNPLCRCCYKARAPIAWAIYYRICKNCQQIETTCTAHPWSLIPVPFHAFKPFSKILGDILPTHTISVRTSSRRKWIRSLFLKADVEAFFGRFYADGLSDNDTAVIIEEVAQRLQKRNKFAVAGRVWEALLEAERDKARERLKSLRYEKVIGKLKEEGWAKELEKNPFAYAGLMDVAGVRVAKPLTDGAWKGLKPSVLTWMSDKRKETILSRVGELTRTIESTQLHRGPSDSSYSIEDVCWIPGIRAIITGGSAEEFMELRAGLVGRLPALAAEFKEARAAALLPLLPYENPSMEKLSLATTWFKCEHSWCPVLQPKDALVHSCFKQTHAGASESDRNYADLVGKPWGIGQGASFYDKAAQFARELILAIGGDPETMTHEEMVNQESRFVLYPGKDATIESFDSMVRALHNGSGGRPDWMTLMPEEISAIISLLGSRPSKTRAASVI